MVTLPPSHDSQANPAASSATADLERRVMEAVKVSEARGDPLVLRVSEVAKCFASDNNDGLSVGFPNAELASILVSNLCFSHNSLSLWKLLEQAMASRLVHPWHVLALLTPRLIPHRRTQPEGYRLYLELMRRYALLSPLLEAGLCRQKITKSIDDALQLFNTYRAKRVYFGTTIVLFTVNAITALIDSSLDDWGLPFASKDTTMNEGNQPMDLDMKGGSDKKDQLRRTNTFTAFEVVENMSSNKRIMILLRLAYKNMPELFDSLLQRLRFIEAHKLSSKNLISINHLFENVFSNIQNAMNSGYEPKKRDLLGHMVDSRSNSPMSLLPGVGKSGCWISIDILLESCMEGKTLMPVAAFELLKDLAMTLHVINQASWQETFGALWISALRLVQRDKEPIEGPIPHLDARLSVLLAIIPLSIAPILKEESDRIRTEGTGVASRKQGLVACLQSLGQFTSLLSPPQSVRNAANDAASKAAKFIREFKAGSGNLAMMGPNDSSTKAVGNLLHLVVEACIARDLLDTSAYFWPGYVTYVSPCMTTKDQSSVLIQDSPWSNFMQGAPLNGSLQSKLTATPAPSVAELEKLSCLALNGSDEERSAASKILCGASLTRGWNIQETVVRMAVKLLSPPMPPDSSVIGDANHYLTHMHMLNAVLSCLCNVEAVHILALYGMVPEVAAILMPLCEVFGSFPPPSNYRSSSGEEVSVYSSFSFAFLFLLRLYNFYAPAQASTVSGRAGPVRHELNLDYLLLLRNSRIGANRTTMVGGNSAGSANPFHDLPLQSVYIDSFPKLRAWYFQNQACVASVLSGLCNKSPVHQVANRILNMICRKMNNSGGVAYCSTVAGAGTGTTTTTTSSNSMSGSSSSVSEDAFPRPLLPAWEVLEAIPFVLEAVLTACAYGRLPSRDLTIGLRDLVDFFPASLAGIVSYFSAEITRGIWPNVAMNGIDWPCPDKSLHLVEAEVKDILARAGVHIQKCYPRGLPPMLPLPMAALVSLTITFKIDKSSEYSRGVVGQALENCAEGCSWPSMPIIGALWTQKAPRWHHFIILSCTRCPFVRDKDAIAQLAGSCFEAFLGPSSNDSSFISSPCGVTGLLGQSLANNSILRPGFLFLRTCRTFHDTHFISELIFKLVQKWARKMAGDWTSSGPARFKSGCASFSAAVSAARQVAILGASMLCVAGRSLLVQVLYEDTVPTILLSSDQERSGNAGPISCILEGYAMSYMMFFSVALVWGIRAHTAVYKLGSFERRARLIATHMDFIARVLDGNVILGCDPAMWKAHVSCFVGLIVRFAPAWVQHVKVSTLRKVANGLRGWHECELALALLELRGPPAIDAVIELL